MIRVKVDMSYLNDLLGSRNHEFVQALLGVQDLCDNEEYVRVEKVAELSQYSIYDVLARHHDSLNRVLRREMGYLAHCWPQEVFEKLISSIALGDPAALNVLRATADFADWST